MKAYLILDISIHDMPSFSEYIQKIPGLIEKHSGAYIVQGVEPTVLEGDWRPERVVIIEFPSRADANSFMNDPEAQSLFEIRHNSTKSNLILVDGCL